MLINNILLRRLPVPKNVTLSNSRTFYAKYVRVSRGNLPPKVRVARVARVAVVKGKL